MTRLLIAGGGTGGHLYPGIAIAEAWLARDPGAEVLFVGTLTGLEVTLLPNAGWRVEFVRAGKLKGAGLWARLKTLARLPLGVLDALGVVRRFRPDLVVSVGGYAAAPTVIAAWLRRVPSVAVEPNAVPGLTNRLLGRLARRVLVAHEVTASRFRRAKARVVGVPLRAAVVARIRDAAKTAETSRLRVLVFGGSQGARFLNERVPPALAGLDVAVLHQTGPADHAVVVDRYREAGLAADVRPYIDDMAAAYAGCDIAVTRAGASTVAELAASGTPALLVPLPVAADDHQAANAMVLDAAGAGRMVRQAEWQDEAIGAWIRELAADRPRLRAMAERARSVSRPDAAAAAADECAALIGRAA